MIGYEGLIYNFNGYSYLNDISLNLSFILILFCRFDVCIKIFFRGIYIFYLLFFKFIMLLLFLIFW